MPLIAFFFSAVLSGSITLQLRTQLHSSLGGILTGVLVLFVLLFGDARKLGILGQKRDIDAGAPGVGGSSLDKLSQEIPTGE